MKIRSDTSEYMLKDAEALEESLEPKSAMKSEPNANMNYIECQRVALGRNLKAGNKPYSSASTASTALTNSHKYLKQRQNKQNVQMKPLANTKARTEGNKDTTWKSENPFHQSKATARPTTGA